MTAIFTGWQPWRTAKDSEIFERDLGGKKVGHGVAAIEKMERASSAGLSLLSCMSGTDVDTSFILRHEAGLYVCDG